MRLDIPNTMPMMICLAAGSLSAASLLMGWFGGYDVLTRFRPEFQAMVPSTAVCFGLLTIALAAHELGHTRGRKVASALATAAIALALVNFVLRLFVSTPGIDGFLLTSVMAGDSMSFATIGLICLAAVLTRASARTWPGHPTLILGGALAGLSTTGSLAMSHSLNPDSPYRLPICDGLSLYELTIFAGLFTALILLHLRGRADLSTSDEFAR